MAAKKTKKGTRKNGTARKRGGAMLPRAELRAMIQTAFTGILGAVLGGFIVNQLPIKDGRVKAFLPLALGLGVGASKFSAKNAAIRGASLGLVTIGGLSLVNQFTEGKIPLLSGMIPLAGNSYCGPPLALGFDDAEKRAIFDVSSGGGPVNLGADDEDEIYQTPADMM